MSLHDTVSCGGINELGIQLVYSKPLPSDTENSESETISLSD